MNPLIEILNAAPVDYYDGRSAHTKEVLIDTLLKKRASDTYVIRSFETEIHIWKGMHLQKKMLTLQTCEC